MLGSPCHELATSCLPTESFPSVRPVHRRPTRSSRLEVDARVEAGRPGRMRRTVRKVTKMQNNGHTIMQPPNQKVYYFPHFTFCNPKNSISTSCPLPAAVFHSSHWNSLFAEHGGCRWWAERKRERVYLAALNHSLDCPPVDDRKCNYLAFIWPLFGLRLNVYYLFSPKHIPTPPTRLLSFLLR